MAQNLLSKLCLKYRISNTDVGRIAERAKTGRNGIFNTTNWLYSTLRGPDFLNRMTLFVAKCMHDGVWNAFSLDKNGDLKYFLHSYPLIYFLYLEVSIILGHLVLRPLLF